jgi:hypothetical protein
VTTFFCPLQLPNHRQRLYGKLGVHSKLQLILMAFENDWFDPKAATA